MIGFFITALFDFIMLIASSSSGVKYVGIFGNLVGIVAAYSYCPNDGPRYFKGHGLLIELLNTSTGLGTLMTLYLRRENPRRNETGKSVDHYTEAEKKLER
jgi:hypothetical protein